MTRFPLPWRTLREALGGDLLPGVYAIAGPIGCGKTQLALQIAACSADAGISVSIAARIDPRELRARVEGIRTHTDWVALDQPVPLNGMRLGEEPASHPALLVIDGGASADDARRAALDHQSAVLLILDPTQPDSVFGFVPAAVLARAPSEIAAWVGVAPAIAAGVDALLVLAPDRPRTAAGWMTLEIGIAKHRRGPQGRVALRFNGTWFEEEAQEIDLGI